MRWRYTFANFCKYKKGRRKKFAKVSFKNKLISCEKISQKSVTDVRLNNM